MEGKGNTREWATEQVGRERLMGIVIVDGKEYETYTTEDGEERFVGNAQIQSAYIGDVHIAIKKDGAYIVREVEPKELCRSLGRSLSDYTRAFSLSIVERHPLPHTPPLCICGHFKSRHKGKTVISRTVLGCTNCNCKKYRKPAVAEHIKPNPTENEQAFSRLTAQVTSLQNRADAQSKSLHTYKTRARSQFERHKNGIAKIERGMDTLGRVIHDQSEMLNFHREKLQELNRRLTALDDPTA